MKNLNVSDEIMYIGVEDIELDLFENQYRVPEGISYNSYVILDEKIAIMDTIDKRKTEEWIINLENVLSGREPDYLVVSHLEPDHSYNIEVIMNKYPNLKIVGNSTTFKILPQFFNNIENLEERKVLVKEGDVLELGTHALKFLMAPMVHWPEVMVAYESKEKVLFSADAFGRFGKLNNEDWDCEARRYYFNIIGKYGQQVQLLLKKLSLLDINIICPLHGPVLKQDIEHYTSKYNTWSNYLPENKGTLIAYASIHGNTEECAIKIAKTLKEKGEQNVATFDLTRCDISEAIEDAFRYDKMILASSSYNMGVFTPMYIFLIKLKGLNFQKRRVALVENGTWAPSAGKCMKELLSEMKEIDLIEPMVTIQSRMNEKNKEEIDQLIENILK